MLTLDEAKRKAARIAMGDLLGTSEGEEYPFNAVAFRKTLPQDQQREVEDVIVYIYHNECWPPELRKG